MPVRRVDRVGESPPPSQTLPTMRFMIFRKADAQTEAGLLPSTDLLTAMTAYNESLSRAGVLLAGEGLKPSAEGVRYHYTGGEATVTDGPFAETKELVAGFTTIQARSLDEAVAWARRGRRRDAGGPPGARAGPLVRHSGPRPAPVHRHLERSASGRDPDRAVG